jgi:predicted MFS family arabinose efflux permease
MIIGVATNNQRGTANSTLLTSWDLGIGIGILLGGSIVEYLGYAAAFWWIAFMHIAGALLFFLATRTDFLRNHLR